VSGQNYNLLSNAMWNVIITLTTTGYGEFYPKSNLGRFIGLIICFWGTFMVSFFVVTVNNMLTFTPSEEKSYTLLLRLHFKEELKRYAVNVLSSAYKHRNIQMREPDNSSKNLSALRRFRGNMLSFQ
jgi:potassium intermediate/small conductance calcium-activated channel subfamily N protein 2